MSLSPTRQACGRAVKRAEGTGLSFQRSYPVSARRLWDAIASSAGLAAWIGEYDGDPATGQVAFRMTAEAIDSPAMAATVHRCEPGRAYEVSTAESAGGIRVILEVEPIQPTDGAGAEGQAERSQLTFTHLSSDPGAPMMWGPGWEYYLDRLADTFAKSGSAGGWPAAETISPTLLDFNDYPEHFGGHYGAITLA